MSDAANDQNWYQPKIDRKVLRGLTRKSDLRGLLHLGGFWGVQIALAWIAIAQSGTASGVGVFLLYSLIFSFNESLRHECHHRTPFRSQKINSIVHWVAGFLCIKEALSDRWLHTQHHTYTLNRQLDPEIMTERPPSFVAMLGQLAVLPIKLPMLKDMLGMAYGRFPEPVLAVLPQSEKPSVIWSCRFMLAGYASVFALALVLQSVWPILLIFGARLVGGFLQMSFAHTQHVGLPDDITDHRLNTRTIYLNPVLQFCYWNMNYHAEHHLYPSVPFHKLPALHEIIKDQMPPAYPGMTAVWKELIPTLVKQRTVNDHSISRPLP